MTFVMDRRKNQIGIIKNVLLYRFRVINSLLFRTWTIPVKYKITRDYDYF